MRDIDFGSPEHKVLFCRDFIDSHDPFKPEHIRWPDLDAPTLARLKALPVWTEAVNTEYETALKVGAFGAAEKDPLMSEAIILQGREEERHFRILELMTAHYGIPVVRRGEPKAPEPEWGFLGVGYAECFDSFFAFGLFALARRSGFFPRALIDLFEPILQEEARHILFFANWAKYRQQRTPLWARPAHSFGNGLAASLQVVNRLKLAFNAGGDDGVDDNFMMDAKRAFGDVSARSFVELCLAENERRMAPYDPRLARPRLAPAAARWVMRLLPADRQTAAA
ncbi:MAG: ferritin-like domain-containing protein [Elusimicrobia bacterium]|nr:ferritin-like domain-containing protein [Elusimicrobiota bacterium]